MGLVLTPKRKRAKGAPPSKPVARPAIREDDALRLAAVAKALGDPIRLQLVDLLRTHPGELCVCELVPLFDLSQPTLSHHLQTLRRAGLLGCKRQGLWVYYYVLPDACRDLAGWLTPDTSRAGSAATQHVRR